MNPLQGPKIGNLFAHQRSILVLVQKRVVGESKRVSGEVSNVYTRAAAGSGRVSLEARSVLI